ncbi:MAG TPA: NAD(P)/FAD-dependent oxidoreductase [Cyclobacteriaceae bacterium]|nr:NAD(P)/FAD-dependent oxidoreductase [Cyclobacteriaceae bacterium]
MQYPNTEVIILGGSYAGLSAAMALGRSLRNVLIIDNGLPCNRQTPQSHNFLTQDGQSPSVIRELAKAQVLAYPTVQWLDDTAVKGEKVQDGFLINTASGQSVMTKKLIVATGIKDMLPDIKGFADCWGISVVHCPYCHGYEFRNQKTGILANGDKAFHLASLVKNLTDDLTILTAGKADFNPEQRSKFEKHNIKVVETEVTEIEHSKGVVNNIVFKDGSKARFDALYAAVPFVQHSDIPASLGCKLTAHNHIEINHLQQTTVSGIYACGDNSSGMRSVANAVSSGNLTGGMVNKELTEEAF